MSRFWIENIDYSPGNQAAKPYGHGPEHLRSCKQFHSAGPATRDPLLPQQVIYCVDVCGFTFRFRGLIEMTHYRDYFASKHLPSQRKPNPRRVKNTGDRRRTHQTRLARVPLWLKTKGRRSKVANALTKAIQHFGCEKDAE